MRLLASAVVASLLTIGGSGLPAIGDDRQDLHPDVEYALEHVPGGTALSARSAEWPELDLTLEVPLAPLTLNCSSGSVCAFSGSGGTGTKLEWGSCGTHSTSALSRVRSISNAKSGVTLYARQGTTVRASATGGSLTDVPLADAPNITNVNC